MLMFLNIWRSYENVKYTEYIFVLFASYLYGYFGCFLPRVEKRRAACICARAPQCPYSIKMHPLDSEEGSEDNHFWHCELQPCIRQAQFEY